MADFSFEQDTRVFQNRDALTEQYTPDELVGRDEELTEFHAALQPVINGENPSNIFIYGKNKPFDHTFHSLAEIPSRQGR